MFSGLALPHFGLCVLASWSKGPAFAPEQTLETQNTLPTAWVLPQSGGERIHSGAKALEQVHMSQAQMTEALPIWCFSAP